MGRWSNTEIRLISGQLFRYGIVGISTNAIGYLAYLGLMSLGLGPKLAMTLLYGVGVTLGFIGNRRWTFSAEGELLASGTRYIAAYLAGYVINFLLLQIFVDTLGYRAAYIQAACILVVAAFLFMALKFFVFPGRRAEEIAAPKQM